MYPAFPMDDMQLHKDRYHYKLLLILLEGKLIFGYHDIWYDILISRLICSQR